jgi:hypothetical protein
MSFNKTTCHRKFRLPLHLMLTVMIGLGVTVPQAVATLSCNHPCCTTPAKVHMQHDAVHISGPSHPSCCGQPSSDSCQLCSVEGSPWTEITLHAATCCDPPTPNNVSTVKRNQLPDTVPRLLAGWEASPVTLYSGPVYLQTLTLLI